MSNLKLVTLTELGIYDDIAETGRTFKENALLKANYFGEKTNMLTLADDGGLEIHALGNEPGIYSRRWPTHGGEKVGDDELVDYALMKMMHIPWEQRTANLISGAVIFDPQTNEYEFFEERIHGYITDKKPKEIMRGYPYRAIFYIPELKKLFQDLTEQESNDYDHRTRLCNKIIQYLQRNYV